jgi:hypothetical protein
MPDALNYVVHADQDFYIRHTRSGIQGAAADVPTCRPRDRPRRVGQRRKGPKDNERSITVAAGPISIKSNSCRHSLSMRQLRLRLVRPAAESANARLSNLSCDGTCSTSVFWQNVRLAPEAAVVGRSDPIRQSAGPMSELPSHIGGNKTHAVIAGLVERRVVTHNSGETPDAIAVPFRGQALRLPSR